GRRIVQFGFRQARAFVAVPRIREYGGGTYGPEACDYEPYYHEDRAWWISIGKSDVDANFVQAGVDWDNTSNTLTAFIQDPYFGGATFLPWTNGTPSAGGVDTFFIQISIDNFNNTEALATIIDETTLARADGQLTNLAGHVRTDGIDYFEE